MAKNNKRCGFTLVELIVVLVILAILAALLIPALTGYIDKAKKNQVIAETRMLTQAAQTELVSLYASDEFGKSKSQASGQNLVVASKDGKAPEGAIAMNSAKSRYNDMVSLAELSSLTNGKGSFFIIANFNGAIRWTVYNDGKGYIGIFCKDDGSMEAFKEDEVAYYQKNYSSYFGKIICMNTVDSHTPNYGGGSGTPTQTKDYLSKNNLYFSLGIDGYQPDEWHS